MAGPVRNNSLRIGASLFVVACAQGEPLKDDTAPYEPAAPLDSGASSGGAPAATTGGSSNVSTGGLAPVTTGGVPPTPAASGGASMNTGGASTSTGGASTSTGGASMGGAPPSAGGTTPSTGGTPAATGGAMTPMTGGAPSGGAGSTDFDRCVALTKDDACTRCVCSSSCQAAALACGASSDTTRNAACTRIVECGMAQHCTNIPCYCGPSGDLTACQTAPAGPCVAEIQAAAGSSDFATVAAALTDVNHAVNLANAVGDCAKQNCAGTCGL